ncbi:MAG: hypothetical protein MRZ09_07740 [Coprobacillus sp.]|nr:hypothetical protein [Coprobacillus sp.]MCI6329742.1 hypothetical protein [Erysipelotrichaceae bacterium]
MRKLLVFLAGIVLLLLLCSGFFVDFIEFFTWLFTLQYIAPDTSIFGNIIVRILTFAVSYTLVGIIFNTLGWFNRKIMSIAYFVVSTLLGFALAYVVMLIEEHLLEIGVVLSVIFTIAVVVIIFIIINNKNNK